ncbi:hypothetical protein C8Q77DRAFT_1268952 [Trametes polyzona]|nr:hypothetical protein C8Q77DRAFT_1268952 [Trametes polyzona]
MAVFNRLPQRRRPPARPSPWRTSPLPKTYARIEPTISSLRSIRLLTRRHIEPRDSQTSLPAVRRLRKLVACSRLLLGWRSMVVRQRSYIETVPSSRASPGDRLLKQRRLSLGRDRSDDPHNSNSLQVAQPDLSHFSSIPGCATCMGKTDLATLALQQLLERPHATQVETSPILRTPMGQTISHDHPLPRSASLGYKGPPSTRLLPVLDGAVVPYYSGRCAIHTAVDLLLSPSTPSIPSCRSLVSLHPLPLLLLLSNPMAAPRRCKHCVGPDGLRVLLQGHRCPHRLNVAPAVPLPQSAQVVDSISPSTPATPAYSSSPFNPDTIHLNAVDVNSYYNTHSFDNFGDVVLSPSASTPLPSTNTPDVDTLFNFGPISLPLLTVPSHDSPYNTTFLTTDRPQVVIPSHSISEPLLDMAMSGLNINDVGPFADGLEAFLADMPSPSRAAEGPGSTSDHDDVVMQLSESAAELFSPTTPASRPPSSPSPNPAPSIPSNTPSVSSPTSHLSEQPAPVAPASSMVLPGSIDTGTGKRHGRSPCRKRKRRNADDDSDSDEDRDMTFIENTTSRRKVHSKRARSILNKVRALNTLSRPHVLLYCSRPESVCHKNGSAIGFMSKSLEAILGPTFIRDMHEQVMNNTHEHMFNPQVAIDLNREVERVRREKEDAEAARAAAEARVAELERRINEGTTA